MGLLDPKPQTQAGLDAAVTAKINDAASATQTALAAKYEPLDATGFGYLVTSFTANGTAGERLSVFYSPDGKTVFGGGANLIYSPTGGVRDPSTIKVGATWFTAYTINNGYNLTFGVAQSTDLINWTLTATVDVSAIPAQVQTWAPEMIQDSNGDVYVFFSRMDASTIGKTYYVKATNAALTAWTAAVALNWTAAPANIIDPTFVKSGNTWYCFFKNETTKYIERATASTLTGTYTIDQTANWSGWGSGVEGPQIVKVSSTTWRIYVDRYLAGTGYAWSESTDLTTWTALTGITLAPNVLPGGHTIRHGSFVKLTDRVSATTAMAAAYNRVTAHAEYTASPAIAANTASNAGTLTLDAGASRREWSIATVTGTNQIRIEADGFYSFNWVGNHGGTASGAGAYMAMKDPTGAIIYATVDLPTASGAASIGFPAKFFVVGNIVQFYCQFGNALTLNSRITIHRE